MEVSLIGIVIFLVIIGLILYVIQLLPIDATIKRIIVGSSRVDLQACKLEYSIVSPK